MTDDVRSIAWWNEKRGSLHEKAFHQLEQLRTKRADRIALGRETLYVYGAATGNYGYEETTRDNTVVQFNAMANALRTIASKTTKSRILPMAVTTGASWEEKSRAKEFNRFIAGLFSACKVWDLDWQWVMDSLLSPDGFAVAKVYTSGKDVKVERVFSTDLIWDEQEARNALPRTFFQVHRVDRQVAMARMRALGLKDAEEAIRKLEYSRDDPDWPMAKKATSDMIVLYEGWHRPSGPDADDGRYWQGVSGADLVDMPWKRDSFPFRFMHFELPVGGGLRSVSPGRQLLSPQQEFDRLNASFQEANQLLGLPKLLVPRECGLQPSDLTDENATIVPYDATAAGVKPEKLQVDPISADQYEYRREIAGDMLRYPFGITEMSANGQIPAGITAARAIQMVEDNENERLGPSWRNREKFYSEIAEAMLDEARDIAKENGGYVVLAPEKRALYRIDIKDVDIAKDRYKVQVFPTSLLSRSPAARYDQLSEMRRNGDIDEREFRQLLDMPDLDAENDLETATTEIIDKTIDAIMSKGKSFIAEAFDDHALIILRGGKAYNLARLNAPDEDPDGEYQRRLRSLASYIASAQSYITAPQPAVNLPTDAVTPPGGAPGVPAQPAPAIQGTPMQPFATPV